MPNVLIIGRGGREHALAWKLSQSATVFIAPGNPGTAAVAKRVPINETDFDALAEFATQNNINLTVVGPEAPLAAGIADVFARRGLPVFGPTAAAARIEGSKAFAKNLMQKHGIPTAAYAVFDQYETAHAYLATADMPIVIKADGLAAGKGVIIAQSREEADAALVEMFQGSAFGEAGRTVVIERFLQGEEFSLFALVHEGRCLVTALSQDHKRAYDGDEGPNTGGMGAYSPVPQMACHTAEAEAILHRTIAAMQAEGCPFTGFLYGGFMATPEGVMVIEFNARLGDPEAQVLLPRLENDLYEVLTTLLSGADTLPALHWSADAAVGVVLAAEGYPGTVTATGAPIPGLDTPTDALVFHSGTAQEDGKPDGKPFTINGGRVLVVVGKGATLEAARAVAYSATQKIACPQLFYRKDIGQKALK